MRDNILSYFVWEGTKIDARHNIQRQNIQQIPSTKNTKNLLQHHLWNVDHENKPIKFIINSQIMNSLLPNSDLNWRKYRKPLDHTGMT